MSSLPPPPPGGSSGPPSWPTSAAQVGQRPASWWTGGRITAAVVVVVVLMGLSALAGFMAGAAWSGIDAASGFDAEDFLAGDDGIPGAVELDTEVATGDALRLGDRVSGQVGDRPVEHALALGDDRMVDLEVTQASFDSVLVVLDADGAVVASDDDGGQGTRSRIRVSLDAGDYAVRVQSWSGAADGGGYTLEAR